MTAGGVILPFRVSVIRADGHAVLRLSGELDCASAPELEAALGNVLRTGPPHTIVVEASALRFADVVGIGVLIDTAQQLAPAGRLQIRGAGRQIVRLLDLLGHSDLLERR